MDDTLRGGFGAPQLINKTYSYEERGNNMGRAAEENIVRNVKFTYTGTNNDINLFLTTVIKDYLIKNKFIDERAIAKTSPSATNTYFSRYPAS